MVLPSPPQTPVQSNTAVELQALSQPVSTPSPPHTPHSSSTKPLPQTSSHPITTSSQQPSAFNPDVSWQSHAPATPSP